MGTRSCLLDIRPRDTSPAGFHSWPFMTVHNWGESPQGTWLLEIHNEGRYQAHITGWQLNMYGTKVKPGSAEAEEEAVRVANDKAKSLGVLRDPSSAAGEEEEEETSPRNDSSCSRRLSSGKCIGWWCAMFTLLWCGVLTGWAEGHGYPHTSFSFFFSSSSPSPSRSLRAVADSHLSLSPATRHGPNT